MSLTIPPSPPAVRPVVAPCDGTPARSWTFDARAATSRDWAAVFGARWRVVLAVGVVLVWAIGAVLPLADYDLGMHLRVGEWIVTHGALPRTEPFAWTRAGAPYLAYSWLAETSYFLLWRVAGPAALQALNGFVLLAGVLAVGAFARVARYSAWTTALLVSAHVLVVGVCAPTLRPQGLLAVILPLCWTAAARLARSGAGGRVVRWPYAVLAGAGAFAANTHLFAPACAAALALVLPSSVAAEHRGRWRTFAAASMALGGGLLCTPYVLEWGAIYRLNFGPTPLLRFPTPITELVPGVVYLTRGPGIPWFVALGLALLPWVLPPRADDGVGANGAGRVVPSAVPSALLWLSGLLFFGLAIRGIYLWWLVCLPLVAAALARVPVPTPGLVGRVLRAAPIALLGVIAAGNAREGIEARAGARSGSPRRLPNPVARGALRLADSLDRIVPNGRGRVATTLNYGNALLWRLPRYSMSLDGRAVFPDSAIALERWVRSWQRADTLRAPLAGADVLVLPAGHTGLTQVARAPGWERVAREQPAPGTRDVAAGDTAEVWARTAWLRAFRPSMASTR